MKLLRPPLTAVALGFASLAGLSSAEAQQPKCHTQVITKAAEVDAQPKEVGDEGLTFDREYTVLTPPRNFPNLHSAPATPPNNEVTYGKLSDYALMLTKTIPVRTRTQPSSTITTKDSAPKRLNIIDRSEAKTLGTLIRHAEQYANNFLNPEEFKIAINLLSNIAEDPSSTVSIKKSTLLEVANWANNPQSETTEKRINSILNHWGAIRSELESEKLNLLLQSQPTEKTLSLMERLGKAKEPDSNKLGDKNAHAIANLSSGLEGSFDPVLARLYQKTLILLWEEVQNGKHNHIWLDTFISVPSSQAEFVKAITDAVRKWNPQQRQRSPNKLEVRPEAQPIPKAAKIPTPNTEAP